MTVLRKIAQPRRRKPRDRATASQKSAGFQHDIRRPEAHSENAKLTSNSIGSNNNSVGPTSHTSRSIHHDKSDYTDGRDLLRDSATANAAHLAETLRNNDTDIDFAHDAHAHRLATLHSERIAADPGLLQLIVQSCAEGIRARHPRERQQASHQQRLDTSANEGHEK